MAGEGGRRGRRDNGLDATAFVPLVDVDPRVGEHLLDVLGSAGVPAYLEPSVDVEPYTRALSLPSPPTDRLWVDRDQRLAARQIVEAETPHGPRPRPGPREDEPSHGLPDLSEERAWQAIVAAWDAPPAVGDGPGRLPPADGPRTQPPSDGPRTRPPADGPRTQPSGAGPPAAGTPPAGTPPAGTPPAGLRPAGDDGRPGPRPARDDLIADPWSDAEAERSRRRRARGGPADTDPLPTGKDLDRAAEARAEQERDAAEELWIEGPPALEDDADEHFDPPPPPPVPRPSRHTVLAAVLVALGILLLAAPGFVGLDDRGGMTLGVAAILSGGALLVLRLRETRSDDGPDDGAIV